MADSAIKLLHQNDVAARWKISPKTLEAWRSQRRGPPYLKIGGRVRYRLEDIERWEAEQDARRQPSSARAASSVTS